MKKLFTLFAAVLMVGSMMAERTDRQMMPNNLSMKNLLNANRQKAVAANYAPARTAEQSTNALSISYNSTISVLNITATNDDPYFFCLTPRKYYSQSDYSEVSLLAEIESWPMVLDFFGELDDYIATGNATINPEKAMYYNEQLEEGEECLVIAVPYDGEFNGTPVYFTFTYVAPTMPTSYTNLTFDDAKFDRRYLKSYELAYILGANADTTQMIGFMYYVNDVATGDYTADSPYGASLGFIDGTDSTTVEIRAIGDFSVVATGDENYTLTSHMLGMNGVGYFVTMNFSSAWVATDTVAVTFEPSYDAQGEGGWNDVTASQGWWQYQGVTEDQSLYITLSNYYTISQAAGTYTLNDMYPDYTYIYDIATQKSYPFVSLTVVVAENAGVVTVTAEGLCENGIYYVITCNTVITPTALENATSTIKATKVIENGQMIIIRDGKRYNAVGAQL